MEYQIKSEDLEKCFNFAIEYFLGNGKITANRTTGQYRGLGGIMDSFVIGKLIEIGVAKIIERNCKKKCILDFRIWGGEEGDVSDPDIHKIIEFKKEREPHLYIEIKNISKDDRWIGLTAEQFRTILSNKLANENPKKVILIYASLVKKNKKENIDPLGVYLKSKIKNNLLNRFCDVDDLYVKVYYIMTGEDLIKYGIKFDQGSYLYETEIIKEASSSTTKRIFNSDESYKKIHLNKNKLPIIMSDKYPAPKEFGEFHYNGEIDLYLKTNYKDKKVSSRRTFIHCKNNTVIKNKVLGTFNLKKGKVYECWFITVGMNPILKRNNIWIAQRNLNNIISKKIEHYIKEISKDI